MQSVSSATTFAGPVEIGEQLVAILLEDEEIKDLCSQGLAKMDGD